MDTYASKHKPKEGEKKPEVEHKYKNCEVYFTTPYINIEKVNLPDSSMPCVVYDLSG